MLTVLALRLRMQGIITMLGRHELFTGVNQVTWPGFQSVINHVTAKGGLLSKYTYLYTPDEEQSEPAAAGSEGTKDETELGDFETALIEVAELYKEAKALEQGVHACAQSPARPCGRPAQLVGGCACCSPSHGGCTPMMCTPTGNKAGKAQAKASKDKANEHMQDEAVRTKYGGMSAEELKVHAWLCATAPPLGCCAHKRRMRAGSCAHAVSVWEGAVADGSSVAGGSVVGGSVADGS